MTHWTCFSAEDRFLSNLSSQSSTSSAHLQLPTPPEVLPEPAGAGPPEPDSASVSEGTAPVTFPALGPKERNTLNALAHVLLSLRIFAFYTIECAPLDTASYHATTSVLYLTCKYLNNQILFSFIYLLGILLF